MAHVVAGLILTGLGAWGMVTWWNLFGLVMRGVIPFALLLLGVVAILASCRRLSQQTAQDTGPSLSAMDADPDDILSDPVKSSSDDLPSSVEQEVLRRRQRLAEDDGAEEGVASAG